MFTKGQKESSGVERLREVCDRLQVDVYGPSFFHSVFNQDCSWLLGSGSYGTCSVASVADSWWVAKTCVDQPWFITSLVGEIEALWDLRGLAGVQKLIGVCPETLTLITEYSGETWATVVARGQSVQEYLEVISQVCRILETIHARGWVHVDIKADNICLQYTTEGIQVTIIDFGLAMLTGERGSFQEGSQCTHIAPEVLNNLPCTPAADVYSIARVFELSANYCDFSDHFPLRLFMTQVLKPRNHRRPGLRRLIAVCSKAIVLERRYSAISA
ncbi:calcium/calmodulin-dependent protein kinase type 1-like [Procambarus clarkii]|uniref:calcium/calmodulin-dependent protein kinase type 1-like n=1 Tax=Procambarus clarkii TaxID=6728 RepID=UPI0037446AF2